MKLLVNNGLFGSRKKAAFTLEEVIVSSGISGLGIAGIISGYVLAAYRADWTSCSVAAQNLAQQRMEEVRAAKWDAHASPVVDELQETNFPTIQHNLDLPQVGTNGVTATITTSIRPVSSNPSLKVIQVDCVWSNGASGPFTNTLISLRAADQ